MYSTRTWRRLPMFFLIAFCVASKPIGSQARRAGAPGRDAAGLAQRNARPASFSREGFTVSNQDESNEVRVHGYFGADGRFFAANLKDQQHDVLLFRRVRPLVEGTLAHRIDFLFMPDFGEGKPVVQEVYIEWKAIPFASLRIGKFKTPIGIEVLRSDRDLDFVERSMVSDLLPLRDLGAQVGSSFLEGAITYEAGFFSGTDDGTNAKFEWRGTNEGVVRVFFKPFVTARESALQPLSVGAAVSAGHSGGSPPRFTTIGQETFFKYLSGVTARGQHKRLTPQAGYFYGPVGLLAEYAISGETLRVGSRHRYLSNQGWQFAGSIVLTGEKNAYDGFEPAHPFAPSQGLHHWGAWEIAFRHSTVAIDANAFPQYSAPASSARKASESAVGVNWYLNRYVKLMSDYEYTTFQMDAEDIPRLNTEHVFMTRVQMAF